MGPERGHDPAGVPGDAWVLLRFAVAGWIFPKVQLYITVSELRFCMRRWWGVAASKGPARGRGSCRGSRPSAIGAPAIAAGGRGAPQPEVTYFVLVSA